MNKLKKSVIMIFDNKVINYKLTPEEDHLKIAQKIINNDFDKKIDLIKEMKNQKNNWACIMNKVYNIIVILTYYPNAVIYLPDSINYYQINKLKEINDKLSDNNFYRMISYKNNAYESDIVVNKLLQVFFKESKRLRG